MSSGNKQLVKFIREGVRCSSQNAKCRPPWSPEPSALFAGRTVKKKGEDGIFD